MKNGKSKSGFLLVEVLVGLALVLIAASALGLILQNTVHCGKTASTRLQHDLARNSWRNRLLSCGSDHPWLAAGKHSWEEGSWRILWEIKMKSPELRQIKLDVIGKDVSSTCRFHSSSYIHGSNWNQLTQSQSGREE